MDKYCKHELTQQKEHSPISECCEAIVGDEEHLIFTLLDPLYWNSEEKTFSSAAFGKTKLKNGEVSVCRKEHSSEEEVQREIIDTLIDKDSARRFVGILLAQCGNVRSLLVDPSTDEAPSQKAYCVVDDGRETFRSHAHLGFSEVTTAKDFWNNNQRAATIGNLKKLFEKNGILGLEECFNN